MSRPESANVASAGAPPATPTPSILADDDPRTPRVLISLLELSAPDRRKATARCAAESATNGEHPIFVTDDADFSDFTRSGYFYEYLPPIVDQIRHRPGARWDLYVAARIRTILAKWRPASVRSAGMPIDDFIKKTAAAHCWKSAEF